MITFQMQDVEIVLKGDAKAAAPAPKKEDPAPPKKEEKAEVKKDEAKKDDKKVDEKEAKKDDKKKDAPAPEPKKEEKPAPPKPLEPLSKYLVTREGDLFWNVVVFYLTFEAAVCLYVILLINVKLQQENDIAEDNIGEWMLNMESVPRMQKKFQKLQESMDKDPNEGGEGPTMEQLLREEY